jgi:restriction endonuclease
MANPSRRKFVSMAGTLLATATTAAKPQKLKNKFIHHVYFWLKNNSSKKDKQKLIEGLKTLTDIKTIDMYHIGEPAGTSRDVIDSSYSLSWMLVFKNKEAQDRYQDDPVHLQFVKEYSHLWSKVVVYDSVDA